LGGLRPALDQVDLLLDRHRRVGGLVEQHRQLLGGGDRRLLLNARGGLRRLPGVVVLAPAGGQTTQGESGEGDCGDGPSKTHAWSFRRMCGTGRPHAGPARSADRVTGPTNTVAPLFHRLRPGWLTPGRAATTVDRVTIPETSTDTTHVVICTTGGTITASTTSDGVVRAGDSVPTTAALLGELQAVLPGDIRVSVRPVLDADSSSFGPAEWDVLVDAVADVLTDPTVSGVVLTHGTDTLEETAMALDLHHDDPRPVAL